MHLRSVFRATLGCSQVCSAGLVVAAVFLVASAGPASAHGQLLGGSPIPGSTVASAPAEVRLTFSERPTTQSALLVRDGCQRDVTGEVSLDANAIVASNQTGQPGQWTVDYSIATDDGHVVTERTGFRVSGSKDCKSTQADDEAQSAPPVGGGMSPWLIALGAAAALIIAGAVTARLLMRRGPGTPAGRPGS